AVDQLILRAADTEGPAEDLRNKNLQFSLTATDAKQLADLRELGKGVELHTVSSPQVAEVLLRPVTDPLADDKVREAVAALIDRDELIETGTGGGPAAKLRADAQVLAPSQRAYKSTLPSGRAKPNPARAEKLLRQAGYRWSSSSRRRGSRPRRCSRTRVSSTPWIRPTRMRSRSTTAPATR